MCLIVLGRNIHPKYELILVANRDEFYARPTQVAHYWDTPNKILAGKDLEAGGTWLGVNRFGHLAAVTNYRDPINYLKNKASRGEIPVNFLESNEESADYLKVLSDQASKYNGFNLLALDHKLLRHYNNQEEEKNTITTGIHAISNATLDTPWPKVTRAKQMFQSIIESEFTHDEIIEMMGDTQTAAPEILPDTGISRDLEKAVSAMCIRTEKYGTCSTTAITISREGEVEFTEKSYPVGERIAGTVRFRFKIDS